MPKLTAQDREIRSRWSTFLRPLIGVGGLVPIQKLSQEIDKVAEREGDNRAELYAYLSKTRTPRAERVFQVGEALRDTGISWSTGIGALWAAGYLTEYTRRLADFAHSHRSLRDEIIMLGVEAPLFASPGLALDLRIDRKWLDADRHMFSLVFVPGISAMLRDVAVQRKNRSMPEEDELLEHAATLGQARSIKMPIRERIIWTLVVEWGIYNASAPLRKGRIASLNAFLTARQSTLIETVHEGAVARAKSLLSQRRNRKSK